MMYLSISSIDILDFESTNDGDSAKIIFFPAAISGTSISGIIFDSSFSSSSYFTTSSSFYLSIPSTFFIFSTSVLMSSFSSIDS